MNSPRREWMSSIPGHGGRQILVRYTPFLVRTRRHGQFQNTAGGYLFMSYPGACKFLAIELRVSDVAIIRFRIVGYYAKCCPFVKSGVKLNRGSRKCRASENVDIIAWANGVKSDRA